MLPRHMQPCCVFGDTAKYAQGQCPVCGENFTIGMGVAWYGEFNFKGKPKVGYVALCSLTCYLGFAPVEGKA